ncbi:MAG: hypothetical protein WD810_02210 [Solirubrobacterales bacterium]
MRDKLNNNPIAQVGLVALLVVAGAILLLSKSGGGEEEESAAGATVATVNGATATGDTPGEAVEGAIANLEAGAAEVSSGEVPTSVPAPPPPAAFTSAYESGKTVVLLVVHDGGIDDALTAAASAQLATVPDVALFRVPARQLARYASITVGLNVNRVPALVVMRPRRLSDGIPQATVDYGFQTPQSVVQAVLDASYMGPEGTYHPN